MTRWLLPLLTFVALLVFGGAMLVMRGGPQAAVAASPWNGSYFPNYKVTDQHGKTYRFWDDVMKERTVVVNFMFTGCSQLCPLTTARLAEVRDELGDNAANVRFVSISVDPINDTPEAMRKFADGFRIDGDWLFLTGDPDELTAIRDRLGERSKEKSLHQSLLILVNTKTGEWKKDSSMSEVAHLVRNIRDLDPEWRTRQSQLLTSNFTGHELTGLENIAGQALFQKTCANCHTIGKGDKIGPDLAGVAARRPHDWLMSYIQRPDLMRERGDKDALALYEQYRRVAMPNLQLNETDAADVLSYIARMSAPPETLPEAGNRAALTNSGSSVQE